MQEIESVIDKKRNEILTLARNELSSGCIANFSLNVFLQSHKISKGSFYHHFKSRDDLIFSLLEEESKLYRFRIENEIYKQSSLKDKLFKVFEAYYEDNAKNRWICESYKELFTYTLSHNHLRARKHFETIREDTLYLITQSIQSSHLSGKKRQIALKISEFLSISIDSFFVNYEYFFTKNYQKEELWTEQREKILGFIENLCLLLESNSHTDSKH